MANKSLTLLRDRVLTECSTAPFPLIDKALLDSAIDFFKRSMAWKAEHDNISLINTFAEYDLDIPSKTNIVLIRSVTHGGRRVVPKTSQWLDENVYDWRNITGSLMTYYTRISESVIRFAPVPDQVDINSVTIDIAVAPSLAATTINSEMFDFWYDAIVMGAKYRLMRMPEKPWTNPSLADAYDTMFDREIARARIRGEKNGSNASLQAKSRRFI